MTSAEEYRVKAAEFAAQARSAMTHALQIEYARMAASYLRLAELADQNATTDIVYEPPPDQKPSVV